MQIAALSTSADSSKMSNSLVKTDQLRPSDETVLECRHVFECRQCTRAPLASVKVSQGPYRAHALHDILDEMKAVAGMGSESGLSHSHSHSRGHSHSGGPSPEEEASVSQSQSGEDEVTVTAVCSCPHDESHCSVFLPTW